MNEINLSNLELKIITLQDAVDYCQLNNINIKELYLSENELTDISGIKLFKNLKRLYIDNNKIIDIFNIKRFNIC